MSERDLCNSLDRLAQAIDKLASEMRQQREERITITAAPLRLNQVKRVRS